ncbi:MAG: 30S ribosomal protein S20 [Fimbriimonadaceae bacterium]|jgi:small subunit ribosomal protein S20|nr:30S ribosomal protein S20 [Fimbriimonadaceae bacterium]
MANLKSSKKDVRRIEKKTATNKATKTALKTFIKKARVSTAKGADEATTQESIRLACKALDKAAQKGVIHKNQAARRKSRLVLAVAKASE